MSADEQKIMREAAAEATTYQRRVTREANAKALEQLKEEGMEVSELPPEELAKLKEKAKPVIEKFTADVGPEFVAEVYAAVEQVRAKN
jgi:TRAP-type C4-dicarboxylate transport system substrate-binding protein